MDSHGSLPALVGNDCRGLFRSGDTVPCEHFTISLGKNATETVRFCLSQHLISLAIVDGLSLISCGASSLASRHKDFLIRIRAASQTLFTTTTELSYYYALNFCFPSKVLLDLPSQTLPPHSSRNCNSCSSSCCGISTVIYKIA